MRRDIAPASGGRLGGAEDRGKGEEGEVDAEEGEEGGGGVVEGAEEEEESDESGDDAIEAAAIVTVKKGRQRMVGSVERKGKGGVRVDEQFDLEKSRRVPQVSLRHCSPQLQSRIDNEEEGNTSSAVDAVPSHPG